MNIAEKIYGVGELTRQIKRKLETSFGQLWLRAELSDVVHHRSGHLYLTLKDPDAQIRGVMWRARVQRLDFRPENGTEVLIFGRIIVYEKGGNYQLDIEAMQPAGVGALALEFEKLKSRLTAEGLFDPDKKKPIPHSPSHIGVVTSESGAAIRDVLITLSRRGFDLLVTLVPARVQGDGASEEVASGIMRLEAMGENRPDVIIVARGGGSLEDLWAFNEEPVVRAIANCEIPVICGVGHETDTTLADLAADLRAPTPTGAAERATPDRQEMVHRVENLGDRLARDVNLILEGAQQKLSYLEGAYGLKILPDRMQLLAQQLDDIEENLSRNLTRKLELSEEKYVQLSGKLNALSPKEVMRRGYSVVKSGDRVVKDAAELMEGELLQLHLSQGKADARVEKVIPEKEKLT